MLSRMSIVLLLAVCCCLSKTHAFLSANPPGSHLLKKKIRPFLDSHIAFAKKNDQRNHEDQFVDPLLKELKQRRVSDNPYFKLFDTELEQGGRPKQVHIILFNADTKDQGIHSIEYPKGSGSNFVLAFQSLAACRKFAATLKAQNVGNATPKRYNLETLENFCDKLGVFVQIVPKEMYIQPPTENVESFGHNPELSLQKYHLEYLFDMFEFEFDEEGLLIAEEDGSWE